MKTTKTGNFGMMIFRDLPRKISLVLNKNTLGSGQSYEVSISVRSKNNLSAVVASASARLLTSSKPIAGKIKVSNIHFAFRFICPECYTSR